MGTPNRGTFPHGFQFRTRFTLRAQGMTLLSKISRAQGMTLLSKISRAQGMTLLFKISWLSVPYKIYTWCARYYSFIQNIMASSCMQDLHFVRQVLLFYPKYHNSPPRVFILFLMMFAQGLRNSEEGGFQGISATPNNGAKQKGETPSTADKKKFCGILCFGNIMACNVGMMNKLCAFNMDINYSVKVRLSWGIVFTTPWIQWKNPSKFLLNDVLKLLPETTRQACSVVSHASILILDYVFLLSGWRRSNPEKFVLTRCISWQALSDYYFKIILCNFESMILTGDIKSASRFLESLQCRAVAQTLMQRVVQCMLMNAEQNSAQVAAMQLATHNALHISMVPTMMMNFVERTVRLDSLFALVTICEVGSLCHLLAISLSLLWSHSMSVPLHVLLSI